jgi:hypothetical protein
MQHSRDAICEREDGPSAVFSVCYGEAAYFLWDHKMRNPSMDLASSSRYLKYSP